MDVVIFAFCYMLNENLQIRGIVITVLIGLVMSLYLGRLFYIQVISDQYSGRAESTVKKRKSLFRHVAISLTATAICM